MEQLVIKVVDQKAVDYAVTITNLRQIHPELPEGYLDNKVLGEIGYETFKRVHPPVIEDPTKTHNELTPVEKNSSGEWLQNWEIIDKEFPDDKIKETVKQAYFELKRNAKRLEINSIRDTKETEPFPYMGKLFDANEKSIKRIFTSVQTANLCLITDTPYSVDWTCADNSTLTMNAREMMGVPEAMSQYGYALHQHARTLKDLLLKTTTVEEVEAIDILSGWPGDVVAEPAVA